MLMLTHVNLPPGPLPSKTGEPLLRHVLNDVRWIDPDKYGKATARESLPADPAERLRLLVEKLRGWGVLELAQPKANITFSIVPDREFQRSFAGYTAWGAPAAAKCFELNSQRDGVWKLMGIVRAPLAVAARQDAYRAFSQRWVPSPIGGEEMRLTVQDYTKGLEHPHYRMWFGPEYTAFLGPEHLARAPAVVSQPLDGGGWFVQVLERPEDWDQPAGIEAAARFAAAIPRRVFYDPTDPERPLEAPNFNIPEGR